MLPAEVLAPDVHCLRLSRGPRLVQNVYVRRFSSRGLATGVVVSPGAAIDAVGPSLDALLGPDGLHWVILPDADPQLSSGVAALQQARPRLWILCSRDTFHLARYHGLDPHRARFMEDLPDGELVLPTGHRLQCLPAHHCPTRGTSVVVDRAARIAFTGSVLSSISSPEPLVGLRAFHEATMPSTAWLGDTVARLRRGSDAFDVAAPSFGAPWSGGGLHGALELLSSLVVGADREERAEDHVAAANDLLAEVAQWLEPRELAALDDASFPVVCREAGVVVGFRVAPPLALDLLASAALAASPIALRGTLRRTLANIERVRRVPIASARSTVPPSRPR